LRDTALDDRQREYVSHIEATGETVLGQLGNIPDLSAIEVGGTVLEEEPVELRPLLEGVVDLMAQARAKRHRPGMPP
jgi:hypothetical protein